MKLTQQQEEFIVKISEKISEIYEKMSTDEKKVATLDSIDNELKALKAQLKNDEITDKYFDSRLSELFGVIKKLQPVEELEHDREVKDCNPNQLTFSSTHRNHSKFIPATVNLSKDQELKLEELISEVEKNEAIQKINAEINKIKINHPDFNAQMEGYKNLTNNFLAVKNKDIFNFLINDMNAKINKINQEILKNRLLVIDEVLQENPNPRLLVDTSPTDSMNSSTNILASSKSHVENVGIFNPNDLDTYKIIRCQQVQKMIEQEVAKKSPAELVALRQLKANINCATCKGEIDNLFFTFQQLRKQNEAEKLQQLQNEEPKCIIN